jgi:magnesium chelatase family protein
MRYPCGYLGDAKHACKCNPMQMDRYMNSRQLRRFCILDAESQGLLQSAMDELGLSAHAHDRILGVSRTIADLEGSEQIRPGHLAEAIGYRSLDHKLWAR